jgi:hypothetical protein
LGALACRFRQYIQVRSKENMKIPS